jgi:hypothetical protein
LTQDRRSSGVAGVQNGRRRIFGSKAGIPSELLNSCNSCPANRYDEIVNATNSAAAFNFMGCGDFERTRTFEAAKKDDPSIVPD